jgi:hypothetical protein
MTGPEHYREAETQLELAAGSEGGSHTERYALAAAQVHATLALVAATAMQAPVDGSEPGMAVDEYRAWYSAAGVKPARPTADDDMEG